LLNPVSSTEDIRYTNQLLVRVLSLPRLWRFKSSSSGL